MRYSIYRSRTYLDTNLSYEFLSNQKRICQLSYANRKLGNYKQMSIKQTFNIYNFQYTLNLLFKLVKDLI